jgi:hypothetical protein
MLQTSQIDQRTSPGEQVRDKRLGCDNHSDKKEGQIGEARSVGGSLRTPNDTRDDQARANQGQDNA